MTLRLRVPPPSVKESTLDTPKQEDYSDTSPKTVASTDTMDWGLGGAVWGLLAGAAGLIGAAGATIADQIGRALDALSNAGPDRFETAVVPEGLAACRT